MNKIAIYYRKSAVKTGIAADKVIAAFGDTGVDVVDVETADIEDFKKYDYLILGVATWFEGELPTCWDELVTAFTESNFKGKKFSVFGLGDQLDYSDCFCDAVGIIAQIFTDAGGELVGTTTTEGYSFEKSMALNADGRFMGLCLDFENQSDRMDGLITNWVKELKKEFV